MDVQKVVEFDLGIKWKREHGNNPYGLALGSVSLWSFTQDDNIEKYTFMKLLIQDNAVMFKWGLHKQKNFMVYYHKKFAYFLAPPNIVYKAELGDKKEKKKIKRTINKDKNIFVK